MDFLSRQSVHRRQNTMKHCRWTDDTASLSSTRSASKNVYSNSGSGSSLFGWAPVVT
ncbi:hypothetical protein DPMN_096405 [Dreissena polymorpha]|uniref:Uncharacterized protein n=1 Tax=Dreissena polymorpha TaxID=45954 RepID=A0A9D4L9C7_DREPO|nr:hypothetical protein DPMN_096405 [Dreissena polymorpha]